MAGRSTAVLANYFAGASCAGRVCVAVGSYEYKPKPTAVVEKVPLVEEWDGTRWTFVKSPVPPKATSSQMTAVSCVTASFCMAVGDDVTTSNIAVVLIEEWNGKSWSVQPTPMLRGSEAATLDGVDCLSTNDCAAVGQWSTRSDAYVLAEDWNGKTWTARSSATPRVAQSVTMHGVSCLSRTDCVAVGDAYTESGNIVALVERWNGEEWSIEKTPDVTETNVWLDGVACTSTTSCIAAGQDGDGDNAPLIENWNGIDWSLGTAPFPAAGEDDVYVNGIACITSKACELVGYDDVWAVAEGWNGTKWSAQATPNLHSKTSYLGWFYGVGCSAPHTCAAVGVYEPASKNTYLPMTEVWNGRSWRLTATPVPPGTYEG